MTYALVIVPATERKAREQAILETLEVEEAKLRKKLGRKQDERDKLNEAIRSFQNELGHKAEPLRTQLSQHDSEIHKIFADILSAEPSKKKRFLQVASSVYSLLQREGVISHRANDDLAPAEEDFTPDGDFDEEKSCDCPFCAEDRAAHAQRDDKSTENRWRFEQEQRTRETLKQSPLRETYLRMAACFHPDKASPENRERYGQIMREINIAYNSGDVARLTELARQAQSRSLDKVGEKHATLAGMKRQYQQALRELRVMRSEPPGLFVAQSGKGQFQAKRVIDGAMSELRDTVDYLEQVLTEVRRFASGKLSPQGFLRLFEEEENQDAEDFLFAYLAEFEQRMQGDSRAEKTAPKKQKARPRRRAR